MNILARQIIRDVTFKLVMVGVALLVFKTLTMASVSDEASLLIAIVWTLAAAR